MAKIDLNLIQQLRERTGAGMMDCKKALMEADGDMEKALEILRKKGSAVAAKRGANATKEGVVHAYIHPGDRIGTLVEINCETDFVARTDDMKRFAADLAMHIAAMKPLYLSVDQVDEKFIEHERSIYRAQLQGSGKPDKIVEQIVENKLQKLFGEICLLNQPFIKNDQVTIDEMLKSLIGRLGENIRINKFARFEIGA